MNLHPKGLTSNSDVPDRHVIIKHPNDHKSAEKSHGVPELTFLNTDISSNTYITSIATVRTLSHNL